MFILQKKLVMRMFALVVAALASSGACKEESAQTKFVTLPQMGRSGNVEYLIKKVHDSEWKIYYGFEDNEHCASKFVGDELNRLKNKITESISVWLAPLRDKQGIVELANVTLEKVTVQDLETPIDMGRGFGVQTVTIDRGDAHLSILFRCEDGRSYATGIEINMFQTADGRYSAPTILHEIGHAFGLGDTYVDATLSSSSSRFNESTGGHPSTIGMQPLSVMSSSYTSLVLGSSQLTPDDIAGIKWLYRYYVEGNVDACECPYEYVYEEETGGCRPQYPSIFAAKQGISPKSLDDVDEFGNTALHYAAANPHLKESKRYSAIKKLASREDIRRKNNLGNSAHDILAAEDPISLLYSLEALDEAKRKHQEEVAKVCEQVKFRLAAIDGDANRVQELLASGNVDVNKRDYNGSTVLHEVSRTFMNHINIRIEHIPIFELLLGVDNINLLVKNYAGATPFALIVGTRPDSEGQLRHCVESELFASSDYESDLTYLNSLRGIDPPTPASSVSVAGKWSRSENWCRVVKLFSNTRDR